MGRRGWICLALAGVALPFLFALSMGKSLNHDEHQHVSAGVLLAREGLLPYRDYPHFHTPYLAGIYAVLFALSDHLLFAARMFSTLCAAAILGLLGSVAYEELKDRGRGMAGLLALAIVALGGSASVFIQASGRAWNHDPGLLLAVLATLLLGMGWRRGHAGWFAAAGVVLGLCIGVRLTYAPLLAPFGLVALFGLGFPRWRWANGFYRRERRDAEGRRGRRGVGATRPLRCAPAAAFTGGVVLSLVPMGALWALDPEAFLFGNWEFPQVNVDFRQAIGGPNTMTLGRKFRFLWKDVLRVDLPLLLAALIPWIVAWRAGARLRPEGKLLLLLLPFILFGALAPSPAYRQYFYPLVPLGLAAVIYGLASLPAGGRAWRLTAGGTVAGAVFAMFWHRAGYENLPQMLSPGEWTPVKVHARSHALRQQVPSGTILTLAPLYPLEAGLKIDPAFANGPFAWRVSPFVDPAKAARLSMVSPLSLERHLADHPPAAILLGVNDRLEKPLVDYVAQHGAVAVPFRKDQRLWIMPAAPAPQ